MSESELIPRKKLLGFWETLSRDEIAQIRAVAEDRAEPPPELIARLGPVVGTIGARWGDQDWTFWMLGHMRDFVESLPTTVQIDLRGNVDASDEDGSDAARAEFGHTNFRPDLDHSRALSVDGQGRRIAVFVEGR